MSDFSTHSPEQARELVPRKVQALSISATASYEQAHIYRAGTAG